MRRDEHVGKGEEAGQNIVLQYLVGEVAKEDAFLFLVIIRLLLGTLTSLALSVPASAHHSFAPEFDASKPITLTGVVTAVEWLNPHVHFYVDVKDENGKVTNWGLELGSPSTLIQAGWNRRSLQVGETITVEGLRARSGLERGRAVTVVLIRTGQRLVTASTQGAVAR